MSIAERIKQIQKDEVDKRLIIEASEKAALQARKTWDEENEKRIDLEEQKITAILNESGLILLLQSINDEFLEKRGYIVRAGKGWSGVTSLKWPNGDGYNYIDVRVYPDSDIIEVCGEERKKLDKEQWTNTETIEKTLATAFLSPGEYWNSHLEQV